MSQSSGFSIAASGLRRLATHDVFPEFSARVRRLLYNPLGVLILAGLTALLCGSFLHPKCFVLGGGVLAVVVLGVSWPWLSLRGLHAAISFARTRATEGESVQASLTLANRLPWPAWGLAVRSGFARTQPRSEPGAVVTIASAPGRKTARCAWWFTPACRGEYPLTVPVLTTAFPFGLWENRRRLTVASSLLVWPRTFPVGPAPLVSGEQQVEGSVSRNNVGSNGDVLGVRPYRRGDSPRRIHSAQTARHDRLIVCELQCNARPIIQLVLDADPDVHSGDGPTAPGSGPSASWRAWRKAGWSPGPWSGPCGTTRLFRRRPASNNCFACSTAWPGCPMRRGQHWPRCWPRAPAAETPTSCKSS